MVVQVRIDLGEVICPLGFDVENSPGCDSKVIPGTGSKNIQVVMLIAYIHSSQ